MDFRARSMEHAAPPTQPVASLPESFPLCSVQHSDGVSSPPFPPARVADGPGAGDPAPAGGALFVVGRALLVRPLAVRRPML